MRILSSSPVIQETYGFLSSPKSFIVLPDLSAGKLSLFASPVNKAQFPCSPLIGTLMTITCPQALYSRTCMGVDLTKLSLCGRPSPRLLCMGEAVFPGPLIQRHHSCGSPCRSPDDHALVRILSSSPVFQDIQGWPSSLLMYPRALCISSRPTFKLS